MAKIKHAKKPRPPAKLRFRLTPSGVVGLGLSILIIAVALYGTLVQKSSGALYFVVLGAAMGTIVLWRSFDRG
jgi:hypothetical protein